MNQGPRTLGSASLQIRISKALPREMRDQTREIAHLHCERESQNHGEATKLMRQVCDEADAANITLLVWPNPYGEDIALSQGQLIEWYARRFGFVQIQPNPPLMARMPGSTPRYLTPAASAVAIMRAEELQNTLLRTGDPGSVYYAGPTAVAGSVMSSMVDRNV